MAKKPRAYIDSCCYIELALDSVGKSKKGSDVWCLNAMLKMHRDAQVELMTSTLSIAECQHAKGTLTDEIRKLLKQLITSGQYVTLIQDTILVAEKARDLKWVHGVSGISGADAIHVASALEMSCDYLVTFDASGMHSTATQLAVLGIEVIYPHDFMKRIPGEYRQAVIPSLKETEGQVDD